MASNGNSQHHTLEDLTQTLSKFRITEVPQFPNAYPALNPVDIYRAHITELVAPITGADPEVIYQAIQWTQTLDKGDLVLPVPALRLKGKKPDETAKKIVEDVCMISKPTYWRSWEDSSGNGLLTDDIQYSSQNHHS